jgi:hypothetical protein
LSIVSGDYSYGCLHGEKEKLGFGKKENKNVCTMSVDKIILQSFYTIKTKSIEREREREKREKEQGRKKIKSKETE